MPVISMDVAVESTAAQTGDFYLAVYANAADFEAGKMIFAEKLPARNGTNFTLTLPESGDYLISGYHDVNGNGELDYNMFGVPKEPYGFVAPPPSKYRKPAFGEVKTTLKGGENKQLQLKYWKEF